MTGFNSKRDAAADKSQEPAQEPAEWLTGCPTCGMDAGCDCDTGTWNPPQREWVGLTDEEVQDAGRYAYCRGGTSESLYCIMWNSQPSASVGWCREELISFAQAVEAKYREKNHG